MLTYRLTRDFKDVFVLIEAIEAGDAGASANESNEEQSINSKKAPSKLICQHALERLVKASIGKRKLQRYIRQLTVLAQLRNLREETTKQIQTMPITFDITKDTLYLKGKAEGEVKEREKVKRDMIISLLRNTTLSVAAIAQAAEVGEAYVTELKAKHT